MAELVGRHALAVMLAMHDKTSGRNGNEILEAGLDPVLGFDRVEGDGFRDLLAGGVADQFAHQRLVRGIGKMHGDVPAPVRPLERGERGLVLEEDFGERVDDALGRAFIANGKAGAVGGGGEGHAGGKLKLGSVSV